MAEVLRFWSGFSFPKIEVLVAIAELIAVFEISQQIPSDCLQSKFPSIQHLQSGKIQMLQIGRRFDCVLVGSSKTFLSLQK